MAEREHILADFQVCLGKDVIRECIACKTVQLGQLGEVH